jgi:hypothetical protein
MLQSNVFRDSPAKRIPTLKYFHCALEIVVIRFESKDPKISSYVVEGVGCRLQASTSKLHSEREGNFCERLICALPSEVV